MRNRSLMKTVFVAFLLIACPGRSAQQPEAQKPKVEKPSTAKKAEAGAGVVESAGSRSARAASERNENVWVSKIDNDALKDTGIRLGSDTTLVVQPVIERSYYAAEHGQPSSGLLIPGPVPKLRGWHGELFETHRNSVFNARTFFQVGAVMPSRLNHYGARLYGPAGGIGALTADFSQRKVGGAVNGNALVPLPDERSPLATDPATREVISRFLAAYPAVPPNRPDFDPRALNTNATQIINETNAGLRLDRELSSGNQLSASYSLSRQFIDAFQLVAGRNPDTSIHSHRASLAYRHAVSELTELTFAIGFSRTASDLHPEPNAVGPRVRFGHALEDLGPDSQYPVKRAQNTYRWSALGYHHFPGRKHTWTFGADLYRIQVNDLQNYNSRGLFVFSTNFGRNSIQNLLMGTPTSYEVSIGNMYRGFRNWQLNSFFADQWNVHPRLQIYFGLRHSLNTAPVEVNHLNTLPFGADWNNFSPRFSIAVRGPHDWMMRAAYTISYGQLLPVTYGQIRYNSPSSYIIVSDPDLADPLDDVDLTDPRTSPFEFSPDLVLPYAHQYSLAFERQFPGLFSVRLGYVGSRTIKLLNGYVLNRAVPVPGIPLTTATVNERRPDPRFYSIKRIVNGGIAYLDAAQASIDIPYRRGFAAGASYTFSKAIGEGTSYLSTAANRDLEQRSQSQFDSLKDKKSLSDFDSPHALLIHFSYDLPDMSGRGPLSWLASGWQISGAMMARSGTPFYVSVGSDAPGFGNVDGEVGDRPNILDPSILGAAITHPDISTQILRRDRFSYLVPGQQRGNLAWNAFRKQGIQNINAAVTRRWEWGGTRVYTLQFRAEAFNLTNHAQFDKPQYTLTNAAFGKITNTLNDGRVLQFGLRLFF